MRKWLKKDPIWEDHVKEVRAFGNGGQPGMAVLMRVKHSMMLEWRLSDAQWSRLLWEAGLKESSFFGRTKITSLASTQESPDSDDPSYWSEGCAGGHERIRPVSQTSKKLARRRT